MSTPHNNRLPQYVGGGDLWGEPDPPPLRWWQWLIQAVTLDFIRF